jgi:CRISPR/Cas system-associated exonuclease Cas4 (RecB family)
MHKIFEQATTVDEINYRVDNLANHSLISKEEAEHLKSTIDKALADDIVHEWFNAEWDDIKSEVDIITQDSCRRPDRVMIKDRRAVVVDYKFSEHTNNRYNKQVSEYMQLLSSMKLYDTIEGYVWYIPLGKVVKVE